MFTNTAQKLEKPRMFPSPGDYGFDKVPNLLFCWSRLFQATISQAGTYIVKKSFHKQQCAIYKCEGGCRIEGAGELVLLSTHCSWDHYASGEKHKKYQKQLAALITDVVLNWNPNDPIKSMLDTAAKHIGVTTEELDEAIKRSSTGGIFGGDALSSFFNWNPFSEPPIDRDYLRFCLTKFDGKTDAEVDQKYADEDLGKELLVKINKKFKEISNGYFAPAMCCSPLRSGDKLAFWVNTGRETQVDGRQTEESINNFLKTATKIIDKAKY